MTNANPPTAPANRPRPLAQNRPASRRAFSLLELLVALAVSAILMVVLSSSLAVAFKAKDSAKGAVEPSRQSELSMDVLRADIESAITPNTTGVQVLAGNFEGQDNTVDFFTVADSPEHLDGNGEIKEVELALESVPGSDGNALVRRVIRNIAPLSQDPPPPDEEVICRNVSSFQLEYFDGTQWQTSWDSTQYNNMLPAAVRVTLDIDRPVANGQTETTEYQRVFAIPCSTTAAGTSAASGSTGLPSF